MIAVTGGGTGGHIFPNVAVIEELQGCGVTNICWIGDRRGKEIEWAHGLGVAFYGIRTGKLRRYFSLQNLADTVNVLIGIAQSYRILKKSKPAVLFSKGGFVSVPPAIAAGLLHVPVITHESDIHPGLSVYPSRRPLPPLRVKRFTTREIPCVPLSGQPIGKEVRASSISRRTCPL
jgi:UDP-N-acetylglucosamine--N-acetylmuramyl-(pentapeptide) pyrophosphoryl-undecaprenol N-acetylglucosamine transferase